MSAPCQAVTQCPVPSIPGLDYLSETFSAPDFVSVETGPNQPPPLGWAFANPTITQNGESSVSQQAADLEAWQSVISDFQSSLLSPSQQEDLLTNSLASLSYQEFAFPFVELDGVIEPIY